MKLQIYDKFEGGLFNSTQPEGFGGGSFTVEVGINSLLSKERIKLIHDIIDKFDHTTLVGVNDLELIEPHSLRVITTNTYPSESTYASCIYNLLYLKPDIELEYVKVTDSCKLGYYEDTYDPMLEIEFDYLKGK